MPIVVCTSEIAIEKENVLVLIKEKKPSFSRAGSESVAPVRRLFYFVQETV